MSKAQRKKALNQVSGDLKTHYDNLQYIWDTWGNKGLLAWDLCRISHLAQWGYIADYINLDEAQAVLEPAALRLQKKFDNWDRRLRICKLYSDPFRRGDGLHQP